MKQLLKCLIVVACIAATASLPATKPKIEVQSDVIQVSSVVQEVPAIVEPPKPVVWQAETSVNGADLNILNQAIAHHQNLGLTRQATAMLIGNYLQENPAAFRHGDPCANYGDGGAALGMGQWHPGRRIDMPCTLFEQFTWAVQVEMVRDGGGRLHEVIFDQNASLYDLDTSLRGWERYGHKGSRFEYGAMLWEQIKND